MKINSKKDFLKKKEAISKIKSENKKIMILIGYGTCGIAAGAKEVESALLKELEDKKIDNIMIKKVGCVGFCHAEPTIEVVHPSGDSVLLGHLNADNAVDIVDLHIMNMSRESKYVIHRNFDYSKFDGGTR